METAIVELEVRDLEVVAGGTGGYYVVVQYNAPTYIDTGLSCKPA